MAARIAVILAAYLTGALWIGAGVYRWGGQWPSDIAFGIGALGFAAVYGYLTAPRRPLS